MLCTKKLHLLAGTGLWKISSVECGFSSIKIDYSYYPKSLISLCFSIKYRYSDILLKKHKLQLSCLFCCNHNCYCEYMVSVTSVSHYTTAASRYIMSASHYHLHYKSRSSMYIRVLIPRNFTKLAEAVLMDSHVTMRPCSKILVCRFLLGDCRVWKVGRIFFAYAKIF